MALHQFVGDALIYVGLVTACLLGLVLYSPRMMLQDYPAAIKAMVPPKTRAEKRQSIWLGLPFLLMLMLYPVYATAVFHGRRAGSSPGLASLWTYASGLVFAFNVWDWLIIDWLVFCVITPKWLVIPGSEGHPDYKNYWFHFRGFLIGTVFSVVWGFIAALIVLWSE